MNLHITNLRRITTANITLGNLTVLYGPIMAGKSTILKGLDIAVNKLGARKETGLLSEGTTEGSVISGVEGKWKTSVTWPANKVDSFGNPPKCDDIAAGITKVLDLKPRELSELLINLLGAKPTKKQLSEELQKQGVPETVNFIDEPPTSYICRVGFDYAYSEYKATATKLKGAWEHKTGERFGVKKAKTWTPSGMPFGVTAYNQNQVDYAYAESVLKLEKAIKVGAANDSLIAELTEQASHSSDLLASEFDLKAHVEIAQQERDKAQKAEKKALMDIPYIDHESYPCPSCGTFLNGHGPYVEATEVDLAWVENLKAVHSKAFDELQLKIKAHEDLKEKLAQVSQTVKVCKTAKERLQKILDSKSAGESYDVERCRSEVAAAEATKKQWYQWNESKDIVATFEIVDKIVGILSPDGLRATCLQAKLKKFNTYLEELCGDFSTIQVTPEFEVKVGGRPVPSCSTGERWVADLMVQSLLSIISNVDLMLVDVDRSLDGKTKGDVLTFLANNVCPSVSYVVVAMTESNSKRVVDPKDLVEGGKAYWIQAGNVFPLTF